MLCYRQHKFKTTPHVYRIHPLLQIHVERVVVIYYPVPLGTIVLWSMAAWNRFIVYSSWQHFPQLHQQLLGVLEMISAGIVNAYILQYISTKNNWNMKIVLWSDTNICKLAHLQKENIIKWFRYWQDCYFKLICFCRYLFIFHSCYTMNKYTMSKYIKT